MGCLGRQKAHAEASKDELKELGLTVPGLWKMCETLTPEIAMNENLFDQLIPYTTTAPTRLRIKWGIKSVLNKLVNKNAA